MAIRFGRGGRFIDHVVGTDEDDELYGYAMGESPLSDIMSDTLEGGRGDDFLFGGGGADILRGGHDDDTLEGGTGGDVLDGGEDLTPRCSGTPGLPFTSTSSRERVTRAKRKATRSFRSRR